MAEPVDYSDDSIRSLEDLERKGVMLPFLGPIPYIKGGVTGGKNESQKMFAGYYQKDSQIAEAFRYLRVAINFSATPESLRTLVFTSCLPHEGKSFISHNMAISFAVDGNRTLIVDGDLRRPTIHQHFGVDRIFMMIYQRKKNVDYEPFFLQASQSEIKPFLHQAAHFISQLRIASDAVN